jgi:hypothetical protein
MSQTKVNKIANVKLPDILPYCKMPPEAKALLDGVEEAETGIDILAKNNYLLEACRVYAQALPKRESVWWACMCVFNTTPADAPEELSAPRVLAEQWVRSQKDDVRRAAMDAAKAVKMKGPDAWAGAAAFYSGDSISPPQYAPNKPAPHLPGIAVGGAVLLASLRNDPKRQKTRLARFLESAQDIAGGGPGRLPVESP